MRTLLALLLVGILVMSSRSQSPQIAQHVWGGLVGDSAMIDDGGTLKTWTAEDRRIRHRVGTSGPWTYQDLPQGVEGIVRRIHFLPLGGGQLLGHAVMSDGHVLFTTDEGANWQIQYHVMEATGPADLWDIHFLTPTEGWMVSLNQIYRWNANATPQPDWEALSVNFPYNPTVPEYYALDVVTLPSGERVAVICAQPGIILVARGLPGQNNYDLTQWTVVMDVRTMCTGGTGHMPGGSLTCCQESACSDATPTLELWDIELRRDGTRGAVAVGGWGSQCGAVFVSDDVSTNLGGGFVLEQHECTLNVSACLAATNPPYHCSENPCKQMNGFPPPPTSTPPAHRLCRMPTLYGVAILADGTAVACGYNGVVLARPPGAASPTHAWLDRSRWRTPFEPGWEEGIVYPLFGVSASGSFVEIYGQGGYILQDPLGSWTYSGVQGTSWRVHATVFTSPLDGFLVSQHGRVAKTGSGGITWEHMKPDPGPAFPSLNALAISPGGQGVAVGDLYAPSSNSDLPLIRFNADVTHPTNSWTDALSHPLTAPDTRRLLAVTWAAGSRFVAAGQGGLMLRSDNNGVDWVAITEPSGQGFVGFDIAGVAFSGSTSGVFVGTKPHAGSGGALRGAAWANVSGTWSDVTPSAPTGRHVARLSAVTMAGSTAWAVGETASDSNGDDREGVVLYSNLSGGSFQTFVDAGLVAPLCTLGGDLDFPPPPAPILGAVAVAPNGDVFVGGACGRLYRRLASTSTWSQIEAASASHIRSLSVVDDGQGGYSVFAGCFRRGEETQVILKF